MTGFVKIKNGSYRNTTIANEVFPLVKHYQVGVKGGFITVDGTGQFGKDKIRVLVESPTDIEFVHADEYTGTVKAKETSGTLAQTDEERIADIGARFEMLDDMTKAVLNGETTVSYIGLSGNHKTRQCDAPRGQGIMRGQVSRLRWNCSGAVRQSDCDDGRCSSTQWTTTTSISTLSTAMELV